MQVAQSYKVPLLSKQSTKTSHWVNSAMPSSPQNEFVRITPGSACGKHNHTADIVSFVMSVSSA